MPHRPVTEDVERDDAPSKIGDGHVQHSRPDSLTTAIFGVVTAVLVFLAILLSTSLYFQYRNYSAGIEKAVIGSSSTDFNSIITFSRAWDFAVVKTSAMFLGFTLIFVGALYILRVADAGYKLSIQGKLVHGSLQTSSPGLVLATLGVILVGWVVYSKSVVDYSAGRPLSPPSAAIPNGAAPALPRLAPASGATGLRRSSE